MLGREIKIEKHIETTNFEWISHGLILIILMICSIIYGIYCGPQERVLIENKETVQRASSVNTQMERAILNESELSSMLSSVEVVEEVEKKEVAKKEPVKVITPTFSVKGSLGNDYCVGSTIDYSGLFFYYGDEVIGINDCEVSVPSTDAAGNYTMSVTYKGQQIDIPYEVVEYSAILHGYSEEKTVSLQNYMLDTASLEEPMKLGKVFSGWYRDEACTIPFVSAEQGETVVELYAGFSDFARFACDEAGYITSYTGGFGSITDGLLNLIAHPSCVGVRANAFVGMEDIVTDIYIPANIVDIEAGAFDCLPYVFYIYVEPSNPVYCSVDGVLYTKDMSTVVAQPQGR